MNHIHGLHTLRFIAFLSIFLFHSLPIFSYGYLGVDLFFVISSFLLTFLAFDEKEKKGTFSQRNFFVRRALRIFPLYYIIVACSFFILPIFIHDITLPEHKTFYWLLISNFEKSNSLYALQFLWSIAIEEQFYLLFLVLSMFFFKHIKTVIGILFLIYFGFMIYAESNNIATYAHTITHFPNFAIGMLGGYLYYKKIDLKLYPIFVLVISIICLVFIHNSIFVNLFLSFAFISIILLTSRYFHIVKKMFVFKITEYLGTYTYGLYVFSGFVISFISHKINFTNIFLQSFIELLIIIAIAIFSYHIYEQPFLRLKHKFR